MPDKENETSAKISTDDEQICLICKCGGQLLFCDGKGCNGCYHISCLEPHMVDAHLGVWHCHLFLRNKIQLGVYSVTDGVESICDTREVVVSNVDGLSATGKQFLVKYKGLAYVHYHWVPESQLLLQAPLLRQRLIKDYEDHHHRAKSVTLNSKTVGRVQLLEERRHWLVDRGRNSEGKKLQGALKNLQWDMYPFLSHLLNTPFARVFYPMKAWENLVVDMNTQQEWTQDCAMKMSEAQLYCITSPEVRTSMSALKRNRLLLVFRPAPVSSFPPLNQCSEHLLAIGQLMVHKEFDSTPIYHTLIGNQIMGVQFNGSFRVCSLNVCVTTYLQLDTAALHYTVNCKPVTWWEMPSPQSEYELESSTGYSFSGSVGQNYICYPLIMDPLNFLAWNAHGAASSSFKSLFMDIKN
ncbi:helicase protein MOM1-like isoform X1 [Senna tora]|uniref:Helicase protein MOM1-like isoform X1 n=1 Tax=Senna tora TaxID=362788 RepID=A0A834SHZ8_9FABA|nr:helicase protein MOM1-like isoform X1 [Senna tora]